MVKKRVRKGRQHRGAGPIALLIGFMFWLVGILVSLAVGFGMVQGVLSVPYIPDVVMAIAGWVVVVLIIIAFILKLVTLVARGV